MNQSLGKMLINALVLAILIEIPTAIGRFYFGIEATRDTAKSIGKLTLGFRIHHGYLGLILLLIGMMFGKPGRDREILISWGGGILLSDLFHHFVVLWAVTGSPQFDFRYPDGGTL